jgi:hypothetical protein
LPTQLVKADSAPHRLPTKLAGVADSAPFDQAARLKSGIPRLLIKRLGKRPPNEKGRVFLKN